MKIIPGSRKNRYIAGVIILLAAIALIVWLVSWLSAPSFEIRDWHDLNAVRDNLRGHYILMNDLDSTTDGYEDLASPTANGGNGWLPIGTYYDSFTGTFGGQGYEIRDLIINRCDKYSIGLFSFVDKGGHIEDIGAVNVTVAGGNSVGGLAGRNKGTVSNSYSTGSVSGIELAVGGLVGVNYGIVSNSYFTGSVTGNEGVGGLVGMNDYDDYVSNSYSTGNVTGNDNVGGLVGTNYGTVSNSYSTGNVRGSRWVGGLVGDNFYTVSNSYSTGIVIGGEAVGGLVGRVYKGTVSDSFWDTETSGQSTSDGGTGKNTTEMQDIATFSGAGWNIIAVAPGSTNSTFTWNIVDGETYPFLGSTKSTSQNQQPQEDNFVISLTDSGEIVLSEHEIQAYHNDDNAFILNENGIKKWNSFLTYQTVPKLADSLFSREFVLKIEGQEICKGEFWSYASSTFYSGVVILDSLFKLDTEHNTLWIKSFSMNSNTSLDAAISSELISFFEKRNLQK